MKTPSHKFPAPVDVPAGEHYDGGSLTVELIDKFHRCLGVFLLLLLLGGLASVRGDEFDDLRLKWHDMLTMGANATPASPLYSNWLASVTATAQAKWKTMNTNSSRTYLWSDLNHFGAVSQDITDSYGRLKMMAMGYAVQGSDLAGNAALRTAILGGLDWMYTNCYNETKVEYDNWFDWEIAIPLNLNDLCVLMYNDLAGAKLTNNMNAVNHFTPSPDDTGANLVWKALVVALRGVLVKSSSPIELARNSLTNVFAYVTTGDGFYGDGSFVFHNDVPYNGGYGAQLLDTIGPLMQWLSGSSWAVTDPMQGNLFRWIYDSYQPFIYRGALLQTVEGRYYTRLGDDHLDGAKLIGSILRIAHFAPASDAAAYKGMVKEWLQTDTSQDIIQALTPPYNVWANDILNDPAVTPRGELVGHYQFPGMDRVVHLRPGWGFALGLSSSRMGNFESIRGENLHGWYTGDGMTYLYNGDLTHYGDGFWPTVNPYRLPGTTVDTQSRTNASGEGYLSPSDWAGGASVDNLFGVAGMQLRAWNSSLAAKKSWFLFDDEVVCLGAGINSTDNRPIETIVENRRLAGYGNNALTVNGASKPNGVGWSEDLNGITWAHLAGNASGADLGYYFPQSGTLKALREARSGSLFDLNTPYGSTNRCARAFLTLWYDHGLNPSNATYAYVLLPNKSAAAVQSYAANPDIVVLENSTRAQAVKETTLGITAANFWKDGSNHVDCITVDKKCSIILRNDGVFLSVGISDPTQTNTGSINLEISTAPTATLAADPAITVLQLSPTLKLSVNVNGSAGRTLTARFFVGPLKSIALSPVADAYVQNLDQANTNFGAAQTLAVKTATTSPSRETFLRFDLSQCPGVFFDASLRLVPITVNDPIYHALAFVSDTAWSETGLSWNNKPSSEAEFTRWMVSAPGVPVSIPVGELAQRAAAGNKQLSLRIYSTGTPTPTNGGYTAYTSKENGADSNRPQLVLTVGQVPPTVVLTSSVAGGLCDAPASVTLEAEAQDADGLVTNLSFYSGSSRLAEFAGAACSLLLTNLSAGQYCYTAVATDNSGLMSTSAPVVFSIYSAEPLGRGNGLYVEYYNTPTLVGSPVTRIDATVNFAWGTNAPDPAIPPGSFSARWTGKLQARHAGPHLFQAATDGGIRLWLGGQLVIDKWVSAGTGGSGTMALLPGQYYDVSLEFFSTNGTAAAQLYWTPPNGATEIIPQAQLYAADAGLRGAYCTGTNVSRFIFSRIDDTVNFAWGGSSPDPALLDTNFSVRWTGKLRANQGGVYTFYTWSDSGVRLWVNNQLIISNWTAHAAAEDAAVLSLAAGQYLNLTMEYFSSGGHASAMLMWLPPGESKQVIPKANLSPHQNNNPPVLAPMPTLTAARNTLLTFSVLACDPDTPAQSLSYSLDSGAPSGVSIQSSTGLLAWTPAPTQPLGLYQVVVRATDNGTPSMTDAATIPILVVSNGVTTNVTLAPGATPWRYQDSGAAANSNWCSTQFDDSSWKTGLAPLGYGNGDEATVVSFGPNPCGKNITTYFRHAFFVPDASQIYSLLARFVRNDGIVVYLNGVEVLRNNLPTGAITASTLATQAITGTGGTNIFTQALNPALLQNGTNVVAAEVHQSSLSGQDIRFDLELTGVIPGLEVTHAGASPILKLTPAATLFELWTTTNLAPPVIWTQATNKPVYTNGEWIIFLPAATNQSQFYRLQTQ